MAATLGSAMRHLEARRFEQAAGALEELAGPSGDGVIARFRRAECLSRLGRHEEAVAEARQAAADDPDAPATAVWLQQTLAEAGRYDEAAEVALPPGHAEYLDALGDGYAALARLALHPAQGREEICAALLESRHAPLHSLAIRIVEADRLASDRRGPDLPPVWYARECLAEQEFLGLKVHPPLPSPRRPSSAMRWLRLHASCGDWSGLVDALRSRRRPPEGLDDVELELCFALGDLDRVEAILGEPSDDDDGGRCVDRARLAQLRGEPAVPAQFPGFKDAARKHRTAVAWLDLGAALLEHRPLDARTHADAISDPATKEYVGAALYRWAMQSPEAPES